MASQLFNTFSLRKSKKIDYNNDGFDEKATQTAYLYELSQVYNLSYVESISEESTAIARLDTVNQIINIIDKHQDQVLSSKEKAVEFEHDEGLAALANYYEVIDKFGEKILIRRRALHEGRRKIVQVVAYENAFNVLCYYHRIYNHCDHKKLEDLLKGKYEIPKKCYELFPKCCNVCRSNLSYNKNVQVTIINMPSREENFQSILFYRDVCTDYHLLRPISSDTQDEITIELLKIFTDFGIPCLMYVSETEESFFQSVLDQLNHIFPCRVLIATMSSSECANNSSRVLNFMKFWMESASTEDWAFGCYAVQVKINTTKPNNLRDSPYVKVFGKMSTGLIEVQMRNTQQISLNAIDLTDH